MKKLLMLFAFVAGSFAAYAETLPLTANVKPAANNLSATVEVSLANGSASYVAFQMDINFPEAGTWSNAAPEIQARLENSSTQTVDGNPANFTIATNWINGGKTLRLVGYNLGNQPISSTEGKIFEVTVACTEVADWKEVTITNDLFVTAADLAEIKANLNDAVYNAGITIEAAGLLGDVNQDGDIDTRDITALIVILLNYDEENPAEGIDRADINNDEDIDTRDVTALINIILNL